MIKLIKNANPYQLFFGLIIFIVISVLCGGVAIVMLKGDIIYLFPIASLAAITAIMNMDDQHPTAKEVFWAWILISLGFVATAAIGMVIIEVMRNV